jgi:hypothetical protein
MVNCIPILLYQEHLFSVAVAILASDLRGGGVVVQHQCMLQFLTRDHIWILCAMKMCRVQLFILQFIEASIQLIIVHYQC